MYWVGIDVGGTFTDVVVYDEQAQALAVTKTASTPEDAARGILQGLAKLGLDLRATRRITHGMTLATNAVLEGRGVKVGMVTTAGFRDVLELRRGNRTVLYDMRYRPPLPLVPRSRVHEVAERTLFDGTVLQPVARQEVQEVAARLKAQEVAAVAVCFLHSYVNAANEQAAAAVIQEHLPGAFVCTSAEVVPEFREYERFSTTVLNAYVGPLLDGYLRHLERALRARGYGAELAIVTSSGGLMSATHARRFPVKSMLSGPAAGVAAAAYLGRLAGYSHLITYDMGGTSTDVCLIENGRPTLTAERPIAGYPNKTLQIDINTIGAGGGSIAWLDAGQRLCVGPRSAGAVPGPACYDQGGTEATVTDAQLLLNRLSPTKPLGGEIALKRSRAQAALAALARQLPGLDAYRLAEGIIRLAVAKMTGAIKEITIARGRDPRDFVLFAYGGAGPMHAAQIASELGIRTVVVPPAPGNFSALGMLVSDLRQDFVRTPRAAPGRSPPGRHHGALCRARSGGRSGDAPRGARPRPGTPPAAAGHALRGAVVRAGRALAGDVPHRGRYRRGLLRPPSGALPPQPAQALRNRQLPPVHLWGGAKARPEGAGPRHRHPGRGPPRAAPGVLRAHLLRHAGVRPRAAAAAPGLYRAGHCRGARRHHRAPPRVRGAGGRLRQPGPRAPGALVTAGGNKAPVPTPAASPGRKTKG